MSSRSTARLWRMAHLVLHTSVTLDGVIDDVHLWAELSPEGQAHVAQWYAEADALVLGRQMFEGFASVWPGMRDQSPIGPFINDLPKWVASRTRSGEQGWNGTLLDRDDAVGHVARLKAETDGMLLSTGMGSFAGELVTAGLVDELRVLIAPVVWGRGRRLFHDTLQEQRFDLLRSGRVGARTQEVILRPV